MSEARLMHRVWLRNAALAAAAVLLAGLNRPASAAAAPAVRPAAVHTAQLVFGGAGFDPLMAHLLVGDTLEIRSTAATKLHLVNAPGEPERVNRTVAAGERTVLRLGKPGVYLLYDDTTTRFDPEVNQVAARRDARTFPTPAYAVVLVTDRNGGGLRTSADQVHIPDTSMTFRPWVTVVRAGTPVVFTNDDMDPHVVAAATAPMIMPGPGDVLLRKRMPAFATLALAADGGSARLTLRQPGLYHYFCPVHAAYSPAAHTFRPLKSFGGYPFVMDGVIVVLPRTAR